MEISFFGQTISLLDWGLIYPVATMYRTQVPPSCERCLMKTNMFWVSVVLTFTIAFFDIRTAGWARKATEKEPDWLRRHSLKLMSKTSVRRILILWLFLTRFSENTSGTGSVSVWAELQTFVKCVGGLILHLRWITSPSYLPSIICLLLYSWAFTSASWPLALCQSSAPVLWEFKHTDDVR